MTNHDNSESADAPKRKSKVVVRTEGNTTHVECTSYIKNLTRPITREDRYPTPEDLKQLFAQTFGGEAMARIPSEVSREMKAKYAVYSATLRALEDQDFAMHVDHQALVRALNKLQGFFQMGSRVLDDKTIVRVPFEPAPILASLDDARELAETIARNPAESTRHTKICEELVANFGIIRDNISDAAGGAGQSSDSAPSP